MEHLQIVYDMEVCLRSISTGAYLGYQEQTQNLIADAAPASSATQYTTDVAMKFKLVSPQMKKGPVREGSRVFLISSVTQDNLYLTATSKGELKFDKKSITEEMNRMMYKSAGWSLVFSASQQNLISSGQKNITIYDQICIKSVHGGFLTVKNNLQCECNLEMDHQKSIWNITRAQSLYIPCWVLERSVFSNYSINPEQLHERKNLRQHPEEIQQTLLVEDLLEVMQGVDGVYIKRKGQNYIIEPHLQSPSCKIAFAQLTNRILELPKCYYRVQNYLSIFSVQQGSLCQGLCGGLRQIIKDYRAMVLQIDELARRGLSLQNFWYHVQDSLRIMRGLCELVDSARGKKGGQLISCLVRLINENTEITIVKIYNYLFRKIMVLYVEMLSRWIYDGQVEDHYDQFLIQSNKTRTSEWQYWQDGFRIRNQQVPSILERDAHSILVTGIYLNILKACNKTIVHPFNRQVDKNLDYHIRTQNFSDAITKAYNWANGELMQLVFKECKLEEVLKSIKGYFFLNFGDLFVHFMDAAQQELSLPKKSKADNAKKIFSLQKLQNLFQLMIRTSTANADPFKQQVSCKLDNSSLYQQLNRIQTLEHEPFNFDLSQKPHIKKDSRYVDYLSLEFKVSFPLNLIIHKRSIAKYQVMFRYMFWSKFIERQLNGTWLELQGTRQIPMKCYKPAYNTNHRMINFNKNLIYYLCYEVVEKNWDVMMMDLRNAKSFQNLVDEHNNFLNTCLKQSLLTNAKLLQIITGQLGGVCQGFFALKSYLSKISEQKQLMRDEQMMRTNKQKQQYMRGVISDLLVQGNFVDFVEGYSRSFSQTISRLMQELKNINRIRQEGYLVRLMEMIDEGNYQTSKTHHNSG